MMAEAQKTLFICEHYCNKTTHKKQFNFLQHTLAGQSIGQLWKQRPEAHAGPAKNNMELAWTHAEKKCESIASTTVNTVKKVTKNT